MYALFEQMEDSRRQLENRVDKLGNDLLLTKALKRDVVAFAHTYENKMRLIDPYLKVSLGDYGPLLMMLRRIAECTNDYSDEGLQEWDTLISLSESSLRASIIDFRLSNRHRQENSKRTSNRLKSLSVYYTTRIAMQANKCVRRNAFDDMKQAEALIQEMKDNYIPINIQHYNSIIHGYLSLYERLNRNEYLDAAKKWMTDMESAGLKPDTVTYTSLIECFAKMNQETRMIEWINKMKEAGIKPNDVTYLAMLSYYSRLGRLDDIASAMKEMSDQGIALDIKHYNTICDGLRNNNMHDKVAIIEGMMTKQGIQGNVVSWTNKVKKAIKGADMRLAENMFQNMIDKGIHPNVITCNILVNGYCKANQIDQARKFINNRMAKLGIRPNAATYGPILTWMKDHGDVDGIDRQIQSMKDAGITPHDYIYGIAFQANLTAYDQSNDEKYFDKCRSIVVEMESAGWKRTSLFTHHW